MYFPIIILEFSCLIMCAFCKTHYSSFHEHHFLRSKRFALYVLIKHLWRQSLIAVFACLLPVHKSPQKHDYSDLANNSKYQCYFFSRQISTKTSIFGTLLCTFVKDTEKMVVFCLWNTMTCVCLCFEIHCSSLSN